MFSVQYLHHGQEVHTWDGGSLVDYHSTSHHLLASGGSAKG